MSQAAVRVLLLAENVKASAHLSWYLEQRGCRCWFATCAEEGILLFQQHRFQLILSLSPVRQAARILNLLEQSNCSAFCAYRVEQGCRWLPLMKDGHKCLGAAALRPREFVTELDQMLEEIRTASITACVAASENLESSIANNIFTTLTVRGRPVERIPQVPGEPHATLRYT
jgi:hypothetical protein